MEKPQSVPFYPPFLPQKFMIKPIPESNKHLPKLNSSDKKRLDEFLSYLSDEALHFMGYPCSETYNYSELFPLFSYSINNIGDPYLPSNYHLNTHHFEQEVLDYFKNITHATQKTWGYITSGGTEGNLYGLYAAREALGDEAIVYYSEDSHYSIAKNIHILNLKNQVIKSQKNGEMDYQNLKQVIINNKPQKVIINANLGTTMKGAIDNVQTIKTVLKELGIKHYYIHADAAFFGMILPFLTPPVKFGFNTGIDSIAISGHKMIGSPIPCGICLVKAKYITPLTSSIEYIGTLDNTITGSRNGITPMFLWYFIHTNNLQTLQKRTQQCFDNADYIIKKFKQLDICAWRNPYSFIVVFDQCAKKLLTKWQIAIHNNIAHLIPMPHISQEVIDDFFNDLAREIK
ncbi:histidine decarboxylase [uncultured Candidatus Thioglobus sp.]|nr:histidine decarboxylase [uncultured Candidatus Thioglobus sp.]